jgi:uncharacterized protein
VISRNRGEITSLFLAGISRRDHGSADTLNRGSLLAVKSYTKRILILITGWSFIVLGIAGLFLPFLQGVLFLFVGLIILSSEYVWAHRLLTKLKERFPKLGRAADHATEKAKAWLRRISGESETD